MGIPLEVAARFQINILLSPDDTITLFRNVPTIYFPMLWFEQCVTITPELASQVALAAAAPSGGVYIGGVIVAIGTGILIWAVYLRAHLNLPSSNTDKRKAIFEKKKKGEIRLVPMQELYNKEKEIKTEKEIKEEEQLLTNYK